MDKAEKIKRGSIFFIADDIVIRNVTRYGVYHIDFNATARKLVLVDYVIVDDNRATDAKLVMHYVS
jgi:hypothetical protein